MKLSEFLIDKGKASDGTWVQVYDDGARLLVRCAGHYPPFLNEQATIIQKRRSFIGRSLEASELRDISLPLYAKHLWLGWEKFEHADGKPWPFPEKLDDRIAFLKDLPEFYSMLVTITNDVSNFRPEGDLGNSANGSAPA